MKRWGIGAALAAAAVLLAGCDQVNSAADQVNSAADSAGRTADKVKACGEALGLADLNPDPAKLKERALDKERRLRELAGNVQQQDVKNALTGMADSYLQVQKEHIEDAGVIATWTKRNLERLDALRKVCA
ncbi:hypothetical protein ACFWY9_02715 [Amycolatopsis sp. NPDC059027]|uniref:hypothetical protein n=1 Tax=unclassified Amycolatopsis TaxID=2618356 RepID=UPI00366C072C